MKKSTLITTIAMIVVVVVALSTATYAWFTSSSTAVATTSFSTTAAGEWSMIIGSVAGNNLTFNTAAVDSAELDETAIQKGLWAPTATIGTTIASTNASTTLANKAGFVQGQKSGDTSIVSALLTTAYDSSLETPGQGDGKPAPFAMRLINTSGKERTLQLNITLNAGQSTTNNSLYGAAAVRFYVYEISNAASGNTKTYTSGYNFSVKATGFGDAETLDNITTIQTTVASGEEQVAADRTMTAGSAVGKSEELSGVTLADYTAANIASSFQPAGADNDALGIAKGDHVVTYTFPMQTYAAGGFSNIIIYAWIDGWVADNSAGDAHFSVNFGFNSVPTSGSEQQG